MHLPDHHQYLDDDLDPISTDDPSIHNHTEDSTHDYISLSAQSHTDHSDSDISGYLPPPSGISSEVSSAVTSDSELSPLPPLPPPLKSSKPVRQTGLLNFFPVIPGDEAHSAWGKRKRDNREKDEEERAQVMQQEEEWKQEKLLEIRGHNRISQQKRRKRIQNQEIDAGIRDKDGKKLKVSQIFIIKLTNL